MQIKFDPSGTRIQNGGLQVRFNIYPDLTCKTHPQHWVWVPNKPIPQYLRGTPPSAYKHPDYEDWLATNRERQLNSMFCRWVTIDELTTVQEVLDHIEILLSPNNLATADNALYLNKPHVFSAFMRNKPNLYNKPVKTTDYEDLIVAVNQRFKDKIDLTRNLGAILPITPQSIDVGELPYDGDDSWGAGPSIFTLENPANNTGNIDEVRVWVAANCTDFKVGPFYYTGPPAGKHTCRSVGTIGNVTSGSTQIFNAPADFTAFAIVTGDYIGCYTNTGSMERELLGKSGVWYISLTDAVVAALETTFGTLHPVNGIPLYGEGDGAVVGGGGLGSGNQSKLVVIQAI